MSAPEMTVFVHLTALPSWLALSRAQRQALIAEHAAPILGRYPQVQVSWYDAEMFSARPSDILTARTSDLAAWIDLYEELRDTPMWSVPYFTVEALIPSVENGFIDFEERHGYRDAASS